jgi:hypothetical protein
LAAAGEAGHGGELLLQHSHQLYKWHSDLEAAMSSETEHQYAAYAATLEGHLTTADDILAKVRLLATTRRRREDVQLTGRLWAPCSTTDRNRLPPKTLSPLLRAHACV